MDEIKFEEVYDLSVLTYTGMPVHPAEKMRGTKVTLSLITAPLHLPGRKKYAPGWPVVYNIDMSSHCGTHVDSTLHANKNGVTINELPLKKFMGKGVVLDMRRKGRSEAMTAEDLRAAEPKIQEGDVVILNTGWHKKWGDTEEYLSEHPGLDEGAAMFLVEKKVKMVGMDTICPEVGPEKSHWPHPLHRIMLIENEIPLIEVLGGDIDKVTGKRCYIMAFPVNMATDAAPARVIALV